MPTTAPVTTTDIQGVTTQADIQGENRMWWSHAQSQILKFNNQQGVMMEGVMSHHLLVALGLEP